MTILGLVLNIIKPDKKNNENEKYYRYSDELKSTYKFHEDTYERYMEIAKYF